MLKSFLIIYYQEYPVNILVYTYQFKCNQYTDSQNFEVELDLLYRCIDDKYYILSVYCSHIVSMKCVSVLQFFFFLKKMEREFLASKNERPSTYTTIETWFTIFLPRIGLQYSMTFDSIRFIAMIFCSLRHMITRFVQVDNLLFWQLNLGGQKLYLCKKKSM